MTKSLILESFLVDRLTHYFGKCMYHLSSYVLTWVFLFMLILAAAETQLDQKNKK